MPQSWSVLERQLYRRSNAATHRYFCTGKSFSWNTDWSI